MTRCTEQRGYILLPVVIMLTLVATVAFILNNESALDSGITASKLELKQAEQIARAGMEHATWGAQNSGCAGDMGMTTVPLGQPGIGSYTATVTTPGGATTAYPNLAADQDAWFRSDNITVNNGGASSLHLRMESGNLEYAIVRFDLSTLPAGSQINSATARFYVKATKGHPQGPVQVHRVTADWTETGATWETMSDKFDSTLLNIIPSQPQAGGIWVSMNLTAQVQAWVNGGEANYGIMLIPTGEGTHAEYISREGVASQQPHLDVIVGTGAASPMAIIATGTLTGNPSPANNISRSLKRSIPAYQPPGTVTLQLGTDPGEDTFLDSFYKARNYGGADYMQVHDNGSDWQQYPLIRFDLVGLPRGASVRSARLVLSLMSVGQPGIASVHRVVRSWVEGTKIGGGTADGATWFTHDGTNTWTSAGGDINAPVVAETAINGGETWVSWEIAPLVERWLAGEPNHGLLIKPDSALDEARFASRENSNFAVHPRLTITYACECGSACLAPQGSGNILMVVSDEFNMTAGEKARLALFESWGYIVDLIPQWDVDWNFDAKAANNDVVYVSEAVTSTTFGMAPKLAATSLGVISEEGELNDELGIAAGSASPVDSAITIVDNSHYITAPFASGSLSIYAAAMEQLTVSGGEAPGLQTLADSSGAGSLVVLDAGAMGTGGTPLAGPRVMLPLGRDADFNWDYLNNNGRLIVQRAIQWGTGNTGGCTPGNAADDFETGDYTGNTGTMTWANDWQEVGESDGAGGGDFQVLTSTWCASGDCLQIREDRAQARQLVREVDLSGAVSAKLQFSYRRRLASSPAGASIKLEASTDGTSFTLLKEYAINSSDASQIIEDIDITPYISTTTQIRFSTSNTLYETAMYVDDLDISSACTLTPTSPSFDVLLVVGNATTLSSKDVGYKALIESWGHSITLIDDGDSQANFNTAMDAADVIYVSGSSSGPNLLDKLTNTTKGMVNEVNGKIDNFGFSSSTSSTANFDTFSKTNPAHYITEPFAGNPVTVFTSSLTNPVPGGTLAPDLQNVAEVSGTLAVGTLDIGATRYDSNPSQGRRVHMPFTAAETTDMTADGKTIMQRALEWAASVPVAKEPIAHWKLDETSGPTSVDSIAGHHGTWVNGPAWTSGQIDGALDFDGNDDHVLVSDQASLDITDTITLAAWIRPNKTGTQYVIRKALFDSTDGYELSLSTTGKVFFRLNQVSNANTYRIDSTTSYPSDGTTWMHIAATYDGADLRLYINGVEEASLGAVISIATNDTDLSLGAQVDGSRGIDGVIDDARLYDQPLDATDIADLSGGGGGGPGPGSCDGTYRDEFSLRQYDQNNGTLSWATVWEETGETTDPTGGDIRIDNDVSNYQLQVRDDGQTVWREADLSGAGSATLSFDYRRENLNGSGDYVAIEVSYNGGTNWTELERFTGTATDAAYTSTSYDLESSSLSANTRIRFLTPGSGMGNSNMVWFDNIQIQCSP